MQTTDEQNNELLLTPAAEATTSQPTKKKRERSNKPIEAPEEKHRILSRKQLQKKKYSLIKLDGELGKHIGPLEGKTKIFIYGPATSGKSVFTLKLTHALSKVFGKALYDSHEERHGMSLQSRDANFLGDIDDDDRIYYADALGFDELVRRVQDRKYRVVVRDTIQYSQHTIEHNRQFKKYFPGKNIVQIYVSFGNKYLQPGSEEGGEKEAIDVMHDCDIKIFVYKGKAHIISRYQGNAPTVMHLFDYNESDIEAQSDYNKKVSTLEAEIKQHEVRLRDLRIVLQEKLAHETNDDVLASAQTTSHEPATAPTAS